MNKNKKMLAWLFAGLVAGHAWSAEPAAPVADCAGITDVKCKSRQLFREPPGYAALKPMVTEILDGSLAPIVGLRWPPGEKEAMLDGYDTKRLK